ncbi:hypothetical protein CCACVL1_30883, partial [Corchorus capsularis]
LSCLLLSARSTVSTFAFRGCWLMSWHTWASSSVDMNITCHQEEQSSGPRI